MVTKKNRNKALAKTLTVLFVAALLVMVGHGVMQQPKIIENEEKIAELEKQKEYAQQRIDEIEEMKSKVDSDEYIEKVAREKLGMIRQDEILFVDITGQ